MHLIDSHCHIHSQDFPITKEEIFTRMKQFGVTKAICIGIDYDDSVRAVKFAEQYSGEASGGLEFFACIGVHPHEARTWSSQTKQALKQLAANPKVVAIGEIGLDYHYDFSPRDQQKIALIDQLSLADELNLPVVFHLRESYDDFWPILDDFIAKATSTDQNSFKGLVHSFSDSSQNLQQALKRGLWIGVNGISTFAKKAAELEMFAQIPLESMLLETDAPFLAPKVKRGKKNQPAWTRIIAEDLAEKRGISLEEVAKITTQNTEKLFKLK